jgi:hypothetical protein
MSHVFPVPSITLPACMVILPTFVISPVPPPTLTKVPKSIVVAPM